MTDLEWIVRQVRNQGMMVIPIHWLTLEECKKLYFDYGIASVIEEGKRIILTPEPEKYLIMVADMIRVIMMMLFKEVKKSEKDA